MKRVNGMTLAERNDYHARVSEWCRMQAPILKPRRHDPVSLLQNVIQCSISWNDRECQAWNEGVRLLTALGCNDDTWLPDMLYTKAAKRSIRRMCEALNYVGCKESGTDHQDSIAVALHTNGVKTAAKADLAITHEQADRIVDKYTKKLQEKHSAASAVPVRPKHIDQYIHLLPEKTQERAAKVQGLLRELDNAREKMRLLMGAPQSSPADREMWAKKATAIDKEVKAIYKELDAEWEKIVKSGRVVVDDLGNARVVDVPSAAVEAQTDSHDEPQPAEKEKTDAADGKTAKPKGKVRRGQAALSEEEKADRQAEAKAEKDAEREAKAADREKKELKDIARQSKALEKKIAKMTGEEKAKRLEYLKKWLRDTRTSKSKAHDAQWLLNCRELVKLGGEVTDAIHKAAERYGISTAELEAAVKN